MSLVTAAVVVYGFSHTMGKNLIHPPEPRPTILYFHAAIFFGWLAFFIFQSALIRTHHVAWHRMTGWFGVALGTTIPLLGASTAITMARFRIQQFHAKDAESFLIVPLFDMVAFTVSFALAIYWRKKPEMHRRLILVATCALTAAGFGRFPDQLRPNVFFYAGVDLLILFGVVRDLIVTGRVHRVYLLALPAFVVCQTIVTYTMLHELPYWVRFAHAILS